MLKRRPAFSRPASGPRQRGFSIVELLVGAAVGLFIVGGAVVLFVSNLGGSRQMLLEARVNQDLRAAADMISRDLRRSGYWANAVIGTYSDSAGVSPPRNQYDTITEDFANSRILYGYARDTNDTSEQNEQFGFRLQNGVIQMQLDGSPNWQPVTDPSAVTITALTISIPTGNPWIDVRTSCPTTCCDAIVGTCTATNSPQCPRIRVRTYNVVITGQATTAPSVTRTLNTQVRSRNDELDGQCPS
jgi:prepilin peptidase dependent protein B